MPAPRTHIGVAESYDAFDAAFKAARIPTQLYEGLSDVWVDNPARAHHLIARFKDSGQRPAVKIKAAAPVDVIDQAIERGRLTATEVAKRGPDDAIAKEIDQFFAALGKKYGVAGSSGGGNVLTDSGEQSKPTTKARPVDPIQAIIQGDLSGWDGR